jgi:hypothetical protein
MILRIVRSWAWAVSIIISIVNLNVDVYTCMFIINFILIAVGSIYYENALLFLMSWK